MKSIPQILVIILTLALIGCQKDNGIYIEDELLEYFSRFEAEADQRGLSISISEVEISGYIKSIDEQGVLGTCTSFTDGSGSIIVDQPYWNNATDLQKEYLVFHELGHCVLDRKHDNSRYPNGQCRSIMQSGTGGCRSDYSLNNRTQLIDELFNY